MKDVHFWQEGIMVKIDWKVSNGIELWDEWASKRAFFFFFFLQLEAKRCLKSDLHPPKPPRPKLETIQRSFSNGRQQVYTCRNRNWQVSRSSHEKLSPADPWITLGKVINIILKVDGYYSGIKYILYIICLFIY